MPGSYGLLLSGGMALGVAVGWFLAPRAGVRRPAFLDAAFVALLAGLIGARLQDVIVDAAFFWDLCFDPESLAPSGAACEAASDCLPFQACSDGACRTGSDCLAPLKIWTGGLSYYGGLIAGFLGAWSYTRLKRMPTVPVLALMCVGQPLGHAVGRLGCLLRGCCYGRYAPGAVFSLHDRHPTQLYEAGGEVLLFGLGLLLFSRAARRRVDVRAWSLVVRAYFGGYAVLRYLEELFRGDVERGYLLRWPTDMPAPYLLSTSQVISLVVMAIVLVWTISEAASGQVAPSNLE